MLQCKLGMVELDKECLRQRKGRLIPLEYTEDLRRWIHHSKRVVGESALLKFKSLMNVSLGDVKSRVELPALRFKRPVFSHAHHRRLY